MPALEVTNSDNVIDSRDVIARIAELETVIADAAEAGEDKDEDLVAELAALKELESDANHSEWTHGVTLVRDSYFKEYAQELAEDIGAIPDNAQWPCTCIDWEKAARELRIDYSSVDFDGVTYWMR